MSYYGIEGRRRKISFLGPKPIKPIVPDPCWEWWKMRYTNNSKKCFQSGLTSMEGYLWWGRNLPPTAAALEYSFCGCSLFRVGCWNKPTPKEMPNYKVGFPDNAFFLRGGKKTPFFSPLLHIFQHFLQDPLSFAAIYWAIFCFPHMRPCSRIRLFCSSARGWKQNKNKSKDCC